MDSSNLQHGAICAVGAGTLLIALCLALFLNRLRPSSNPFRYPFSHLPVFGMSRRKGKGWFSRAPAPYGGILSTRVVGLPPRTSSRFVASPQLCPSGLGFRIITAPCGLSPQYAYRVGRTRKAPLHIHGKELSELAFL